MAESCRGTNPLQAIAGSRSAGNGTISDGDYLVVSLDLTIAGTPWLGAGPVVVGGGA
jgi:hypothetical protein